MRTRLTRFTVAVTMGLITSVLLPALLVPRLLGLVHVGQWRLAMTALGLVGIVGVGLWNHRRSRDSAGRAGEGHSIQDLPFALAQVVFGFAVFVGAVTVLVLWAVGHRLGLATSAGVVAYLLSALPVLVVYLVSRRGLSGLVPEIADVTESGEITATKGRRQSLRLRVLLAFQLPLVVSATGIILVEHSDKTAYHQAVHVYHQDRRLRVYDQIQSLLTDGQARRTMAHEVSRHLPYQHDGASTLPYLPYSPSWSALVVLGVVVLLSAYVGRWLSRDVTADMSAIRDALRRLTTEDRRSVTPGGVAMRETADVVAAFRSALIGFEAQRSMMQNARAKRARAERAKARFLAHLSHELKSPLNSILGFSELLLAEIDGPIDDQQREYLSIIWRSGDGLLRFILGVLDLARLEGDPGGGEYQHGVEATVEDIEKALREVIRVDPLAAIHLRVAEREGSGALWPTACVDVAQTARAVTLVAGVLQDAMIAGEVLIALRPHQGALAIEVHARPTQNDPTDRQQLIHAWTAWSKNPDQAGGRASIIPLRLLRRMSDLMGGEIQLGLAGEWPSVLIVLPQHSRG